MESKIEKAATIYLNEEEALWLKGLMQNPLFAYESPDEEPESEREMRSRFFDALEGVGPS